MIECKENLVVDKKSEWKIIVDSLVLCKKNGEKYRSYLDHNEEISYEDSLKLVKTPYQHAAHALIWSPNSEKLWEFDLKASILMQMRFDGYIGFPGGFIDPTDQCWEDGLNRELKEELNLNEKFYLSKSNYIFSSLNKSRNLVLHFYAKEVTLENFKEIELESMNSKDFGTEVMGLIRPPLYSMSRGRGLSVFLSHEFVGNSLIQFLKGLFNLGILSCNEILDAIKNTD